MSLHTAQPTGAALPEADVTIRSRDWLIAFAAAIVALIALYAVFVDNGNIISATGSYLHEFSHDGRHLFGAPCH